MTINVGNLMQQILGGGSETVAPPVADQFHQVAQSAAPEALSAGLAAAFNSWRTPEFGAMVASMFGQANPEQKSGIVNRLLAGLGSAGRAGLGQLGLQGLTGSGATTTPSVSLEQAAQFSPGQVQQLATHAQNSNPEIVDAMSNFYAQHPVLMKSLGAEAMGMVLSKIGNRPT